MLLISGFSVLALLSLANGASAAPPAPAVIAAEVRSDRFVDRLEALGTLRANESVILTTAVTETVQAIHFDDGERVEAGQVLVELTSAEEHALLEEAKATLAEAGSQYQRVDSLAAKGQASRSLLDERRRERATAQARLNAIESRLADRLIKAPFAGVVGLRDISPGALVEPGDRITTLDDDSVMKLDFAVPSVFLISLEPGLGIEASARAYGGRAFRGVIRSVDSRVDPVTRSIQVRALIPNPDRTLKPGVLMQVELLRNPRDALVIPESALLHQGEDHFVLLVGEGGVAERRQIEIGGRRPGEVEVVAGLAASDRVVTHGNDKVRPGEQVEIRSLEAPGKTLQQLLEPGE